MKEKKAVGVVSTGAETEAESFSVEVTRAVVGAATVAVVGADVVTALLTVAVAIGGQHHCFLVSTQPLLYAAKPLLLAFISIMLAFQPFLITVQPVQLAAKSLVLAV